MVVNEIFKSIEGEGIRMGYPVTFIRLQGCNLNCSYCDTRYACTHNEGKDMEIVEILDEVSAHRIKKITLTGGEPLIHTDITSLIYSLLNLGYEVNIETNGSVPIHQYISIKNLIITMDWKSISSGMTGAMYRHNLQLLKPADVLKFVVSSKKDLEDMKRVLSCYNPVCNVFVSSVFGKIEPSEIVKFVLDNNLNNCRVQVQLHKIIWEPTRRGV